MAVKPTSKKRKEIYSCRVTIVYHTQDGIVSITSYSYQSTEEKSFMEN